MNYRLIVAYVQVVVAIASPAIFLILLYFKPAPEPRDIIIAFVTIFGSTILLDRISTAATVHFSTNMTNEVIEKLSEVPSLIARNNNIVVFHRAQAFEHCIASAPRAVRVLNNVMRYGVSTTAPSGPDIYSKWRDAKHASILTRTCSWTEIVSNHLDHSDPQIEFMVEMFKYEPTYYEGYLLDDITCPMIQMTLFDYGHGQKEVLFGWEFPGAQHGVTLMTSNGAAVEFFERYFNHCLSRCEKAVKALDHSNA